MNVRNVKKPTDKVTKKIKIINMFCFIKRSINLKSY